MASRRNQTPPPPPRDSKEEIISNKYYPWYYKGLHENNHAEACSWASRLESLGYPVHAAKIRACWDKEGNRVTP